MATKKKLLEAAAGAAGGGGGLNVEEVFSTYLYTGNGSTQTITNDIDLSGEGGLVWTKVRDQAGDHALMDSATSWLTELASNKTDAGGTTSYVNFVDNSNGYSMNTAAFRWNESARQYASWTFRKAPKFFDVVTYTGTGSDQTINHNLGTTVGFIVVKRTDTTGNWPTWHHDLGDDHRMYLNGTANSVSNTQRIRTATTTTFTVGTATEVNASGGTYVAYLFAHNDGDGDFGSTADQDIIKCGSFTTNGSSTASVNLGWEPQWVIIKPSSGAGQWFIIDSMRGLIVDGNDKILKSDATSAESNGQALDPTSTGFNVLGGGIYASTTYIYIAIRRGPMAVPESATDVFHIDDQSTSISEAPRYRSGFVTDFYFWKEKHTSTDWTASTRLLGTNILKPNLTNAETSSSLYTWDFMNGALNLSSVDANKPAWMWKRAPSFFDVVAYTGNGVAGRTVSHNLGVAPEMMWIKRRSNIEGWQVYISDLGATKHLELNRDYAATSSSNRWNSTEPTATEFTVSDIAHVNASGDTYIAYLFASLAGVSKVGSYTGSTSDQTIDCGFSSGARFVLIKNVSVAQGWVLFDTERGIVAGNDPALFLNATDAEFTGADYIDPHSSGFTLVGGKTLTNNTTYEYIYYAIA